VQRSRETNRAGLTQLVAGFLSMGLEYVPSEGNFILVKIGDAASAFKFLQARGTIIRPVGGLPDYIRISVGTASQNERCLAGMKVFLQR